MPSIGSHEEIHNTVSSFWISRIQSYCTITYKQGSILFILKLIYCHINLFRPLPSRTKLYLAIQEFILLNTSDGWNYSITIAYGASSSNAKSKYATLINWPISPLFLISQIHLNQRYFGKRIKNSFRWQYTNHKII